MYHQKRTSFEEEEIQSSSDEDEHEQASINREEEQFVQQHEEENSEDQEPTLDDEDLLTQQNHQTNEDNTNQLNNQNDSENQDEEFEETPLEEEQESSSEEQSTKSSPVVMCCSGSGAEESIQIDEDDLENLRRDDQVEKEECAELVDDEEMMEYMNDEKIMMPQTPPLINNDNFTTPNSAGSVAVAIPFLEDMENLESVPLNVIDNVTTMEECKVECKLVEEVSENEATNLNSSVLPQEPSVHTSEEVVIENHQDSSITNHSDEQMKVLVMEDDQFINQEAQQNAPVQQFSDTPIQQETKSTTSDIILSINLDEDLDVEMINDFLLSEKGADMCEDRSKESSPHGDSISNMSMNDSWNTNYTNETTVSLYQQNQIQSNQFSARKTFNYTHGIPLEGLLESYDHRIEYSILENLIYGLKEIGIHTVNCLPLIPKKHIMAVKGMDDKLYENLMDSAQSLDPSQSFGFSTASQFLTEFHTKRFKVTTGCTAFDELIGGGFESSSVSELFGESGCGKTQMCFTLCLTAQLPLSEDGPSGKVLFVDTMGTFNPNRIKTIADRFSNNDEKMTTLLMNNILKERIYTSEQLFSNLNRMTNLLKSNKGKPFKLIIVDSAVSIFRSEYKGKDEINIRQHHLLKYLDSLNKLAEQYNVAIVITNQVMDSFDKPLIYSPYKQSSPSVKPVGGHVLAHTIPTRIQLSREKNKRIAKVFKSSTRPEGVCNFNIHAKGILDYEESDYE